MTRTSVYNRVLITLILIAVIVNIFLGHFERQELTNEFSEHERHTINAFAQMNSIIAEGILRRAEIRKDKDEQDAKDRALPTPTPKVITKTKREIRYRNRPTPKPFRLFKPN